MTKKKTAKKKKSKTKKVDKSRKAVTEKGIKTIIGLTERVIIKGDKKKKEVRARIDTGADICSMDKKMAEDLGLEPLEKMKKIKSAHGIKMRPVVKARVEIDKRKFKKVRFTLADRKHLTYKALIGKNILRKGFLIDPKKKV